MLVGNLENLAKRSKVKKEKEKKEKEKEKKLYA